MEGRSGQPIFLYLLGKTYCQESGGTRITFKTKKALLLLAILSVSPGVQFSRKELADLVWPEATEKSSLEGLRNVLANLGKQLPLAALAKVEGYISLQPGFVICPGLDFNTFSDYGGDFMPGHNEDWVLDRRLDLRDKAISLGLKEAQNLEHQEALELVEAIAKHDPLNQEILNLRLQLLEKLGKKTEALVTERQFQSKYLQTFGTLPKTEEPQVSENHPILTATEWLSTWRPAEALSLICSTKANWQTFANNRARSALKRVLAATAGTQTTERLEVEGLYAYLHWIAGNLDFAIAESRRIQELAMQVSNHKLASEMTTVLAYGSLSTGDFEAALRSARTGYQLAVASGSQDRIIEANLELGIMLQHAKAPEAGTNAQAQAVIPLRDSEDPLKVALYHASTIDAMIAIGNLDAAAEHCNQALRLCQAMGSERMMLWAMLGRATLYESLGDISAAKIELETIRSYGEPVAGHSLISQIDEHLARIDVRQGEFDTGAEALARATLHRRSRGTVASVYERSLTQGTKRILKDRLNPKDIAAAYRRASESVEPG